jgi:hypothetical protein
VRFEVPGSNRDWAFTADWTWGDATNTREYFQADGRVITHDSDGTIESWVYFDPDESTQYSLWGSTRYLYLATWPEDENVNGTLLDYPIRLGDGWTTRVEMPQRRWTHIAATWNGPSANLYIDGQLADSTASFTHPGIDSTYAVDFRVGALYDNPSTPGAPWVTFWDGMIDEVRVWNDVRTPSEIAAATHTPVSPSDTNLAAYWDFNQSTGSTVTALGSAGSTATLSAVGTPAYTELATANTSSRTGWAVHEFERSYITAAGGWTVPEGPQRAEVLVVGGGGGGGAWVGGGGGGGGVATGTPSLTAGSVQAVTVGQGGLGSRMRGQSGLSYGAQDFLEGGDGGGSSFAGVTTLGGGLGASWDVAASSAAAPKATGGGGAVLSGTGAAGSGSLSNGGAPATSAQPHLAGGGGGAGGGGVNGGTVAHTAGNGGPGTASSITGSSVRYGGGGGGSAHGTYATVGVCDDCSTVFSGQGVDGGGDGATVTAGSTVRIGSSGTVARGGGGGGAGNFWFSTHPYPSLGGSGGSGVVVVAYPTSLATTLTHSPATPNNTQTITLTATVTAGATAIGGASVAFTADGTAIAGCGSVTTDSSGVASCSWSPASAASYNVTATTSGIIDSPSSDNESITVTAAAPGQPTGVTVTPNGTGRLDLTWTAPASGAAPTDYLINYRLTGTTSWFSWNPGTSTATSESITGLGSADQYDVQVVALASGVSGTASDVATATTVDVSWVSFTATGTQTWQVPTGVTAVDVLVVGGGGGGGGTGSRGFSGGGGAGGSVVERSSVSVTPGGSITVTVGSGGSGGSPSSNSGVPTSGGESNFGSVTASGGGRGGHACDACNTSGGVYQDNAPEGNPRNGGGGASQAARHDGAVGPRSGGDGFGSGDGNLQAAGGGAGAGANGRDAASSTGGAGGVGVSSSITGSAVVYGGGGGGGKRFSSTGSAGVGGTGGGGDGGFEASADDGVDGLGGGGGGGAGRSFAGGSGGDGVVIIRRIVVPTSTPDLATSSDTGQSASDDVTSDTTPTFTGTAQGASTVQLFVDDGSGAVTSGSTCSTDATTNVWSCTTAALVDADYEITAVASFSALDGTTIRESSDSLSVTIDSSLRINAITLPDATINAAYSQTLTASGGVAPFTWSLDSGSLPTGVLLSSGGAISGTPATTGTFTFTVKVTDSNNPTASDTLELTFTVSLEPQTITFVDPADRSWSTGAFTVTATSDSGLTVSLATSTTTVCSVTGFSVTMLRTGTCTLTASQDGDSTYTAAADVTHSFDVTAALQTITFTLPAGASSVSYGDDPFSIAGTTDSDLVLSFSSTTPAVCTVAGDASRVNGATNAVVTPIAAGSCTIVASQAGDARYAAATSVSRSFTIGKAAQAALSFTSSGSATWGDTITAAVSGGSGSGAVTFTATTGTAGCTMDATTGAVTFTSAGTCTLTANKAGDTNHLAATAATQTLTIAQAAQTVTFTSTVPASPLPGGTYAVAASATSGLTPALSITTGQTTVCTLSAGVVTFLATGTCTITASQAGDTRFAAAPAQTQTIVVGVLNQSITVTVPDDTDFGAPAFTLDTSASSGLTVTATSADTDVCTVTGLIVTPVDIGDCDLTLTQTGDSRYAAASAVEISFRIIPALPTAPTITSVSGGNAEITVAFTAPGFTGGVALSPYTITATPTSGTAITDTTCVASPCTITGLTNGTGYTITITANNTAGAGPASTPSPSVTPATKATAVTRLAATPGNGTLRVAWLAPVDFGGGTFTRYELRIAADGAAMPAAASASVASSTDGSYTFTGLDNGTAYNVEVVTITTANLAAIAGNTATLSSVPVSTPATPTEPAVNVVSPRVVRLTWAEPARDGGATVTGYTVTITAANGTTVDCGTITLDTTTRAADCTTDTLALSTDYTITIAAVNRIGAGPVATVTHTTPTFTAPTTPPNVTPITTDGTTDPCPCVYDANGNPIPVDIDRTAPGASPGQITIGDGSRTITIGGSPGSSGSDSSMWVDADGQLVVRPPTALPLDGSGALPGTTVTVFINGVAAGTVTVDADGNWTLDLDLPAGTTGPLEITTVWIDADGNQQTLTLPVDVYTPPTTPPTVTIADDTTCPCVFDADGNPIPVDIDRTPTGTTPGTMTIGGGAVTLGGSGTSSGTGQATTWIDTDGRFTAQTPGTIPLAGAGALPGTTVTIFWNGVAIGTATVNPDGTWTLDLDLPAGTNGPGTLTIVWIDTTGQQRTLSSPLTVIATGDAATAPRTPAGGTQLAPDPDTAIALGPNGERLDTTRTTDPLANTITITVGDTAITVTPVDGGRVGTDGRLTVTHPARIRVTGDGMLPDATATIWVMSTPQRLGTVTIATNVTIDTTYTLPTTIDPGNHTIQIDTIDTDGQPISIALGFTLTAGLLPTTGTDTDTHLAWLTLLLALGGFITLTTTGNRRRRVS